MGFFKQMVVTTRRWMEGGEEQNHKKTKTEQQIEEREVDRISELPDDILHTILSLLTLKEACITSALSKRWRNLFPSLPRLDLSFSSFRYSWPHDKCMTTHVDCWPDSVRDVLESRRAAVRICTICFYNYDAYRKDFGNIIRFLCNDGIRELTLSNMGPKFYTIPSCLYFCRTLTRIELSGCFLKVPSKFSLLRRLNTLRIHDCIGEDADMQRLVLGCRAVERLDLDHCHMLQNLAVDAPNLAVLDITTTRPLAVSMLNAPRLESVTVRFPYHPLGCDHTDYEGDATIDDEGECSRLVGLLESLGNIQNLSLEKDTYLKGLAVPVTLQSLLPKMKRLTLVLRPNDTLMLSVVSCLLNSCPNLEDLVIGDSDLYEWTDYMYPEASMLDYWDQQIPSDCVRDSLCTATVVLKDTYYWEYWIKFAKFLLSNASILKNLVIDCYHQDKSWLGDLPRELLLLRRASPDAVVDLNVHTLY